MRPSHPSLRTAGLILSLWMSLWFSRSAKCGQSSPPKIPVPAPCPQEKQPSAAGGKATNQAFPALLVFRLAAADLYPRIHRDGSRLCVYEPKLAATHHSYRRPLTHRFEGPRDVFNPFKVLWPPIWWEYAQKQDRNVDRALRLNESFYDAFDNIDAWPEKDALHGEDPKVFSNVEAQCRKAGMKIRNRLRELGIITGTIDETKSSLLDAIPGVKNVEKQRTYQSPDPDNPLQ